MTVQRTVVYAIYNIIITQLIKLVSGVVKWYLVCTAGISGSKEGISCNKEVSRVVKLVSRVVKLVYHGIWCIQGVSRVVKMVTYSFSRYFTKNKKMYILEWKALNQYHLSLFPA